jgi:hypothetical protein
MRTWPFLLCGLLVAHAWAGEWRDSLTPPQPGAFAPLRPLKCVYRFGWESIVAAEANFEISKTPQNQYQLGMKTQTIGFVRSVWRLDAEHTASCDATTFRPIRLHQVEAYKAKTLTTDADFSPAEAKRATQVKLAKGPQPPPEKMRKFKCPNLFDLQSALLFLRSQNLAQGERYRIVVFPAKSAYLADLEVVGHEKVKVPAGSYDAIKCQLRLQEVDKHLKLSPHQKFKRAYIWVSDDRDRLIVKVQADIFVGSVWCELQSVSFAP